MLSLLFVLVSSSLLLLLFGGVGPILLLLLPLFVGDYPVHAVVMSCLASSRLAPSALLVHLALIRLVFPRFFSSYPPATLPAGYYQRRRLPISHLGFVFGTVFRAESGRRPYPSLHSGRTGQPVTMVSQPPRVDRNRLRKQDANFTGLRK